MSSNSRHCSVVISACALNEHRRHLESLGTLSKKASILQMQSSGGRIGIQSVDASHSGVLREGLLQLRYICHCDMKHICSSQLEDSLPCVTTTVIPAVAEVRMITPRCCTFVDGIAREPWTFFAPGISVEAWCCSGSKHGGGKSAAPPAMHEISQRQ